MERLMNRVIKWLESDKFDYLSYWFIGIAFSYFLIRTISNVPYNT